MKRITFFVPTRMGSQRVKDKNTRPFADVNGGLLELKLSQLMEVKGVERIVLSTNDPESIRIARSFMGSDKEIRIFKRPDELASSSALVEDFINYIPSIIESEHIFWTHVTAPFVDKHIYEDALECYWRILQSGHHDSLLSVHKLQQFLWSEKEKDIINCDRSVNKWPNTQDLDPLYEINHAFYISSRENYIRFSDRIGPNPFLFELNKVNSIDIDTEDDFEMAEALFASRSNHVKITSRSKVTPDNTDPSGPIRCFLPCRKGSERVANKNVRPFAGVSNGLVELKLRQLMEVKGLDKIILSTNDKDIIAFAESLESEKILIDKRRDELCRSETSTDELIKYVPEVIEEGHVLWTHVTSPFVAAKDYEKAIDLYRLHLKEGYDSLMSVTKIQKFLFNADGNPVNFNRHEEKWPRTQTIKPYFESNSGYFISTINNYQKYNDRIGPRVYMHEIDSLKSFDIDWEEDFHLAESIWKQIVSKEA